jgi:ligand-binding sensor domain-containing protein
MLLQRFVLRLSLLFILHSSSFLLLFAQPNYAPGDWTSYRDFRYAVALDLGSRELYVATTGGILTYQLFRNSWDDPMVVGYGFSEPVEIDDPVLLLMDQETGYLWVATRTQLLQYDVNAEQWRRVAKDLWGPTDRVVNLGVGAGSLYLETIPGSLFSTLFSGSPLPNPNWPRYVTRYKGSRTFGSLMPTNDMEDDEQTRWRGLRSKVKLSNTELFGAVGMQPANFPMLYLANGWTWTVEGTILDKQLKGYPVTDWIVDQWGSLWTAQWGAGIIKADLRTQQAKHFTLGTAGNDLRALLVDRNAVWMGGSNTGENQGFTRSSGTLKSWQSYATRDDSRIRSTEVYDFARFDGRIWIATNEGLLSYQEKGERWERFGVSKNLHSEEIRALVSADSELWIGTTRGLAVMTLPTHEIWRIPNEGIELSGVLDLAISVDTIYASTSAGWFKGRTKERLLTYAPLDPGLLAAAVPEISVLDSEVWAITSQGVMVYDNKTGNSKSWFAATWLNGATPSCILASNQFVWVGTTASGFYRYKKSSGEWIAYNKKDGLVDNRVQVIREDGDDLLIGTANGLTRFYWNRPGATK